jgi:hypothetical protein
MAGKLSPAGRPFFFLLPQHGLPGGRLVPAHSQIGFMKGHGNSRMFLDGKSDLGLIAIEDYAARLISFRRNGVAEVCCSPVAPTFLIDKQRLAIHIQLRRSGCSSSVSSPRLTRH